MSAYIITDNFFLNAYLAISVNCLLSLVSNLIQRSQIKDKIISYNTIICCNTTTGSASQPVLCLPPWMYEVCSEILSDSDIMQNTQGFSSLGYFGSIYYPCQTLKLIITGPDIFSGEHSQRLPFRNSYFLLPLYMDLFWQLSVSSTYWEVYPDHSRRFHSTNNFCFNLLRCHLYTHFLCRTYQYFKFRFML